jgi:hypothetical protein
MESNAILAPMLGTMLVTMAVWILLFIRRLGIIRGEKIASQDLATPEQVAARVGGKAANTSNNLKNLFEVPVLFYALCLALMVTNSVDSTYVNAAYVFFIGRAVHSVVQCTSNIVDLRFASYVISCISLWFMLVRFAIAAM